MYTYQKLEENKMSLKEQVMKRIQKKMFITNEKFEKTYNEINKVYEDRGIKPTEEMVLNRLILYLETSLHSNETLLQLKFECLRNAFSAFKYSDESDLCMLNNIDMIYNFAEEIYDECIRRDYLNTTQKDIRSFNKEGEVTNAEGTKI